MYKLMMLLIIGISISSCQSKKKPSPSAPVPQVTPADPVADPTQPITTTQPISTTTTTATTTTAPQPTPTPTDPMTIPPMATIIVPLNTAGVPIVPSVPLAPEAHIILVSGVAFMSDINNARSSCADLTVFAYYLPCAGLYLCAPKCGYFICRR